MKTVKTLLLRAFLLNKRLLKKPSFLLILCLVPLLTLAMVFLAKEESGILTITLCTEDKNDPIAKEIIDNLLNDDGVLYFKKADTAEKAYEEVRLGTSDAAWIFDDDLQSKFDMIAATDKYEPFVTVVERETDVSLQLSHEKLSGCIFPYLSKSIFNEFLLTEVFSFEEITQEKVTEGYNNAIGGGNLVVLEKIGGQKTEELNYLTAPLRGLLSLVVLLCGLAAVMYHQSDREHKIYDWMSPAKQIFPGIATVGAAALDSTVIIVVALAVSGLFGNPLLEITAAVAYIPAVTSFCTLLGCITHKASRTGQIIPFAMIIALVVSPIFFNLKGLYWIQCILPCYHYLYGVNNFIHIANMLIYSLIMFALSLLLNRIIEK